MSRTLRIAAGAVCFCFVFSASASFGQNKAAPAPADAPPQVVAAPAANAADVSSPDAIVAAVYDVISGPAGQKRDWNRMRSLFTSDARLIAVITQKQAGLGLISLSPQGYIDRAGAYFDKNGFWERETARRTEQWGNILECFSTYESRHDAKDATPFARGINSFQLFNDGTRWWIVTIYWQEESAANPLTPEFLPRSK
ncbi:MAG: hypothetical protein WA737_05635 [Candidatus Acidiferrales bacterium]